MKLTRRNALIGLGSVVVGSGALVGSGAFSSVEADRTVNVSVASDTDANLGLSPNDSSSNSYSGASSLADDGTLELDLTEGGAGLNVDAVTTFDPIFRIINNGASSVSVDVSVPSSSGASIANTPSVLSSYSGPVIQNTITDSGNGTSVTVEYLFTNSGGSGTGNSGIGSSIVDTTISLSPGDNQEVGLVVGVGDPSGTFDPSSASGYISQISITATQP